MTYISCSVQERFVNPLFEVFEGGDFVLSSYRDIEEPLTRMQIFLPDPAGEGAARAALQSALDLGNRTLMMDQGRVIYDVTGDERDKLTVHGLTEKFRERSGRELNNDRMLLGV